MIILVSGVTKRTSPERVSPVDKIEGPVAEGGLAVLAPGGLLLVAVARRVADARGVAVGLRERTHSAHFHALDPPRSL